MTVARGVERGAQGVPSAYLLRLNRHVPANILIVGGTEGDRIRTVRVLHERSRLKHSPFRALDGARDHALLQHALRCWLGHEDGSSPIECAGGTLFVDDPGGLPPVVQRLLLAYAGGDEGSFPADPGGRGPARLAAGGTDDLIGDVASGRLLAALHDTLDKLRVQMHAAGASHRHAGAAAPATRRGRQRRRPGGPRTA